MWDVPVIFLFSDQIRKKNVDRKRMFAALNQSRPEPIQRSVQRKDELLHSKARKELSWNSQELCYIRVPLSRQQRLCQRE